jgi:Trypsin-co-occurring domain 2
MTQIALSDAIQQIRDELREAILEGKDQDIIFTSNSIDVEQWGRIGSTGQMRKGLQGELASAEV